MAARSKFAAQGSRILLVDDEPLNLDLLQQELDGLGFEISTARDGREALKQIADSPPDLIFLDLMMPGIDGFSVLERLQIHEQWRSIPVVIISASDDQANIVRGIELGAVDFLPKPFEPAILQARLSSALEKKRLRDLEQQQLQALERELEIGRQIQAGFLPQNIPQPAGWRIEAHFRAAREVAGDFYDLFPLRAGRTGVLLGDVTDKGVGAALYMALIRTLLRASVMQDGLAISADGEQQRTDQTTLVNAVGLVNRYLCQLHGSAMLASVFFAILNEDSGSLTYVSAGQDPPMLLRGGKVDGELAATGPVVGALETAVYQAATCLLAPGDGLLLYSDGITDSLAPDGGRFGLEGLRRAAVMPDGPTLELRPILAALQQHMDGANQYDDITLLLLQRTPN
ncbi:MAG: SpoIIE family protein phosphatase [Anaerolineales bacterium]|nr:SpoIIE family protein phosphatase [Anaerolineales bacterium]